MNLVVNAATACFPGMTVKAAIEQILAGASEPMIGRLASQHIQCCPQNLGHLSEAVCEDLRASFPECTLRLHANARVLPHHVRYDASTFTDDTRHYYEALADRSRRLGATAYSLHAGFQRNCALPQMIDNVCRIQDIFGDMVVAVEGLYPNAANPQLMDTWGAYQAVLDAGTPLAIDLSHTKIVARAAASTDEGLLRDLLASPTTIEVHISENNGVADHHDILRREPFWWHLLPSVNANAVVFSEGNQLRHRRNLSHSIQ
jgi:hypothetical protein